MIDVVLGIHDGVLTSGGMMITTSQALAASSCPASSSTVDVDLALHAPTVGFFHQWEGLTEKKGWSTPTSYCRNSKSCFHLEFPLSWLHRMRRH